MSNLGDLRWYQGVQSKPPGYRTDAGIATDSIFIAFGVGSLGELASQFPDYYKMITKAGRGVGGVERIQHIAGEMKVLRKLNTLVENLRRDKAEYQYTSLEKSLDDAQRSGFDVSTILPLMPELRALYYNTAINFLMESIRNNGGYMLYPRLEDKIGRAKNLGIDVSEAEDSLLEMRDLALENDPGR